LGANLEQKLAFLGHNDLIGGAGGGTCYASSGFAVVFAAVGREGTRRRQQKGKQCNKHD
jgi:hypothetical protein